MVHPPVVLFILTEEQSLSENDLLSHLMSATPRDNESILQEEKDRREGTVKVATSLIHSLRQAEG